MPHHEAQRRSREAQETVPWTIGKTATIWNFLGTDPTIITAKEVEPGDFALNEDESLWVWSGLLWHSVGIRKTLVTKTGAYTIVSNDDIVLCNAASASFTVTLPAAADYTGKMFWIKKIDSTANTVTVDGAGSETIDDGTTAVIRNQYEAINVISDGTEWWIF